MRIVVGVLMILAGLFIFALAIWHYLNNGDSESYER